MGRAELETLRSWLSSEVAKRRKLGGYSQEADSILNLFEVAYKLACHAKPDKAKKK
jgi:hypothetical protein